MIRPVVLITARRPTSDLEAVAAEVKAIASDVLIADPSQKFGVALREGLTRAAEMGFTHVITLDAAWRHPIDELPTFLDAIRANPDAIITGVRQNQRLSLGQRFARANADFWTWIVTGHWVHDCTYGYRAYPLANVANLSLRCERIAADFELLVKAIWAGTPIREIPLASVDEAGGKLLPIREIHHFFVLTWKLMCERMLLPAPLRQTMHRRPFADLPLTKRLRVLVVESVMQHRDEPGNFAACIGIGVFFGIAPVWGFQMLAAAAVAHALRLSKALVLAGTNISSPLTLPLILYASVATGHALRAGHFDPMLDMAQLKPSMKLLGDYLLGSIVLAIAMGGAAALITYTVAAAVRALRSRRRKAYHQSG